MTGPGRPRNPAVERRILDAAAQLLDERGLSATSIEAIARKAGVGKTTIYRRWPSLGAVVIAAMDDHLRTEFQVTGNLRADLTQCALDWLRLLRHPLGRDVLLSFLQPNGATQKLREDIRRHRYAQMAALVEAAGTGHDPGLLNDLLGATILYRELAWCTPVDEDIDGLVTCAMRGAEP